jgi:RimJ/RimL family protein N-acetyltransferase
VADGPELRTRRLLLRRWRASDRVPFAEMNTDPDVMEYFPAKLTREQSDAMIERIEATFDTYGYGLWAVEVAATRTFIGFTGLAPVPFEAHFTPAVEIGWRLAQQAWGQGYATEAARAAARFGFDARSGPALAEIVSFTTLVNVRSQAVMRRLGMTRDPADDFPHPRLSGHPLEHHVLYRLTADHWHRADPAR